jgi:hypothetical protein
LSQTGPLVFAVLGYGHDIRHSIPQLGHVAFSAFGAGLYRVKQFKHLTSPILVFFFIRKEIFDLNRGSVKSFFAEIEGTFL